MMYSIDKEICGSYSLLDTSWRMSRRVQSSSASYSWATPAKPARIALKVDGLCFNSIRASVAERVGGMSAVGECGLDLHSEGREVGECGHHGRERRRMIHTREQKQRLSSIVLAMRAA